MPVSLDQIVASTRKRVEESRRDTPLSSLDRHAEAHTPRGFRRALMERSRNHVSIIAELKKASPSRGLIRADFDPQILALDLERAGAATLSVLTDEEFFQGSLENLRRASASTKLPCLRKDFIVHEFQILEARANCADAILLIVAALSVVELRALVHRARELDLDILCEVHDENELQQAIDAGCDLIGVNSRDLRTFTVDLKTAFRLAEHMPNAVLSVAESGIHNGADIANLRAAGYRAFLIGEALMKAPSPGTALVELIAEVGVAAAR